MATELNPTDWPQVIVTLGGTGWEVWQSTRVIPTNWTGGNGTKIPIPE